MDASRILKEILRRQKELNKNRKEKKTIPQHLTMEEDLPTALKILENYDKSFIDNINDSIQKTPPVKEVLTIQKLKDTKKRTRLSRYIEKEHKK